ncbi:MAG TPA: hypothetical protein VN646_03225 [Candidatus Acidoferrum sp.]|nr:hypothetical protein [Candidatus Acidoferrum sp.]
MNPTTYRVVRHDRSGEVWIFRVESDVLTGACGPMQNREIPPELSDLSYEDHPDDLDWILRAWEHFEVLTSR